MEQQTYRQKGNLSPAEAMLKSERRKHRNEIDQMRNKITNLELQLSDLSVNFNKVNRKLIAVSPTSHDSDQKISEMYKELCQSVEDWVDANCGRPEGLARKIESNKWSALGRQELNKLLDDGAATELVRSLPRCGDFFLTKIVLRFLFEFVLRQARWIPGMSAEQERILQLALDNFQSALPDRGPELRESWRSDTYKSLSVSSRLQVSKTAALEELVARLSDIMTHFTCSKRGCDRAGLKTIVNAAAELANSIRCCSVQYSFIYTFAPQMTVERRKDVIHTLEQYNLIDVETGVSIRNVADSGSVGEMLCIIIPTLVKLNPNGTVIRLLNGTALARITPFATNVDREVEDTSQNQSVAAEREDKGAPEGQTVGPSMRDYKHEKSSVSQKQKAQPEATCIGDKKISESEKQMTRPSVPIVQKGTQTWATIAKKQT